MNNINDWSEQIHNDIQKRKESLVSLSKNNALVSLNEKVVIKIPANFSSLSKLLEKETFKIEVEDSQENKVNIANSQRINIYCNKESSAKTTKNFQKIIKKQQVSEAEKGLHTLYLCCSVAEWNDAKGNRIKSPLFVTPIQMCSENTFNNIEVLCMEQNSYTLNKVLQLGITKSIFDRYEELPKKELFESLNSNYSVEEFIEIKDRLISEVDSLGEITKELNLSISMDCAYIFNADYENLALYEMIGEIDAKTLKSNPIISDIYQDKDAAGRKSFKTSDLTKDETKNLEIKSYSQKNLYDADSSQVMAIDLSLKQNIIIYSSRIS